MVQSRGGARRRSVGFALFFLMAGLFVTTISQRPADAQVTAVQGYACGYFTNVGLFGGPQTMRGCGQTIPPGNTGSESPEVSLPEPNGSAVPITETDPDGARGVYGPAAIFAGLWPLHVASAPPSGPISVSTVGTPESGTVTSTADIVLRDPPNPNSPGGFGPGPVEGDELHATCTATEESTTGSASFVNGLVWTSTDPQTGDPVTQPIPDNPPPNYTVSGTLNHIGDVYTVVFNQQIVEPDGSLTVNAVHMYLFGTVAVGEMVIGQVNCGVTPPSTIGVDDVAPTCGVPFVVLDGPGGNPVEPQRVFIGLFDAGGLQSITNTQGTNATVQVGIGGAQPYQNFVPGQTGPLSVFGIRDEDDPGDTANDPMSFSFTATDTSGNTTDIVVNVTTTGGVPTATATCTENVVTTTTTTTSTTTTTLPPTTTTSTTTTLPPTTTTSTTTTLPPTTTTSTTTTLPPTTTTSTTTTSTTTTLPPTTTTSTTTTLPPTTTTSSTSTSSTSTSTSSTSTSSTSTTTPTSSTSTSSTLPGSTTTGVPNDCTGLAPTITGTPGNDNITGTPGPDVIVGLGGDDTISGLGGDDTICGNEGNDTITGDAGNDTIRGGSGDDTLRGDGGDDNVQGGEGADIINGNDGNDRVFGNEGDDTVTGGGGDDFVSGGDDNDAVTGGAGDDHVEGNGGDDRVLGGAGNDDLEGNRGIDVLNAVQGDGGSFADTLNGGAQTDQCFSDPADTPASLSGGDC